jgi:uncharacterized protein (DUF2236 family)
MMVGGLSALLLQMLHPRVLAGVWDHSVFRGDMQGRLLRTAQFVRTTTYGDAGDAKSAIDQINAIHRRVRGTLPDGTSYCASDPDLLDWVHVTGATSFLRAWIRYAEPSMPSLDRDRYLEEMAVVASALGAGRPPRSFDGAERLIRDMQPSLAVSARSREVARLVLSQRSVRILAWPAHALLVRAAVDLLPEWARRMHGFEQPTLALPFIRVGTWSLAHATRWALAG